MNVIQICSTCKIDKPLSEYWGDSTLQASPEGFNMNTPTPEPERGKRVICDLDGTLANLDHRLPLIKKVSPEWDKFFLLSEFDSPIQWCIDLLSVLFDAGYTIEIVSGRPFDDTTLPWLRKHGVKFHALWLLGDRKTPDEKLKRDWLKLQKDKSDIAFVIDDRQKVVDMWRREGLVCLQCNAWEEYKK